jgi:hypothetical protein
VVDAQVQRVHISYASTPVVHLGTVWGHRCTNACKITDVVEVCGHSSEWHVGYQADERVVVHGL